jgi:hypothetical protein
MRVVEFLAFLALLAFGVLAFWRGLGTKPSKRHRADSIIGVSGGPYVDPHQGQSDAGHGGQSDGGHDGGGT